MLPSEKKEEENGSNPEKLRGSNVGDTPAVWYERGFARKKRKKTFQHAALTGDMFPGGKKYTKRVWSQS